MCGGQENNNPSIMLLNAQKLIVLDGRKLTELRLLAMERKPSIIIITETWFDSSVLEESIAIVDYSCQRCDRSSSRHGGGVCIYTRNDLSCHLLKTLTSESYSIIFALVRPKPRKLFIVIAAYLPPGMNVSQKEYIIEAIMENLTIFTNKYKTAKLLLCGDFNDVQISEIESSFHLIQIVNFATRGDNTLDKVSTNVVEYLGKAIQLPPLSTADHNVVFVQQADVVKKYRKVIRRKMNSMTKCKILESIQKETWRDVYEAKSVDEKATIFDKTVEKLLDKYCPKKPMRLMVKEPPWMTDNIRDLIHNRNKHFRKGNKLAYKFWRNLVVKRLRENKRNFVKQSINVLDRSTKDWWKLVNTLDGRPLRSNHSSYVHCLDDEWMGSKEAASRLNQYFISIGVIDGAQKNVPIIEEETVNTVQELKRENETNSIDKQSSSESSEKRVSASLILNLLNQIKPRKSSKDVPQWLLKEAGFYLTNVLQHIANTMLAAKKFPAPWKEADVIPVDKRKPVTSKNDFRPISILNATGKICEKVISYFYRQEIQHFQDQFAYVKRGGTTAALIRMFDQWTRELDNNENVAIRVLFLDLTKAFNRMDHQKLISKLKMNKVSESLSALCRDYLNNRQQRVKFDAYSSDFLTLKCGVPQGTVMGPLLWNTYVNDLMITEGNICKYADDITVFHCVKQSDLEIYIKKTGYAEVTTEADVLVRSIMEIERWCEDNNMEISKEKSRHLTITSKKRNLKFHLNGIHESDGVEKFLGVMVDNNLTFVPHVQYVTTKANKMIFWLRVLKSCGLHEKGLVQLYSSKIRSTMAYAAPAWITFLSNSSLRKLDKVESRALSVIFPGKSYKEALEAANLPSLRSFCGGILKDTFYKILCDLNHPLHALLPRKSERPQRNGIVRFLNDKTHSAKRANSFLPWCIRRHASSEAWQL